MSEANQDMLREAIARNSAAVLSLPSAGMLRHHKTRFLGETPEGFWMAAPDADLPLILELIAATTPVGVAFKSQQKSVVFATPITQRLENLAINAGNTVPAVHLAYPESLRRLQRRMVYRVLLPVDNSASLRVWRIPEHAVLRDRPMAAQEIPARLRDLSVMGMGMQLTSRDDEGPPLLINERLRISLRFQDWEVLMEGRTIHHRPAAINSLYGGAAFKKLETDFEGRQILAKINSIVGQLQRDEIARRRAS